jgi:hypothetical protein
MFKRLSMRTARRALVVVGASVAALAVGSGVAFALVTGHFGTSVTRVSVETNDTAVVYTSNAYVNVGSTTIFALAGQFIDARYTAETLCFGGTSGWCSVRILVDGVEAEPVVGTDFAFSARGSTSSWESNSVERVRTVTTSGTHTVTVQAASIGAGVSDRLDDWTLTAMAVSP